MPYTESCHYSITIPQTPLSRKPTLFAWVQTLYQARAAKFPTRNKIPAKNPRLLQKSIYSSKCFLFLGICHQVDWKTYQCRFYGSCPTSVLCKPIVHTCSKKDWKYSVNRAAQLYQLTFIMIAKGLRYAHTISKATWLYQLISMLIIRMMKLLAQSNRAAYIWLHHIKGLKAFIHISEWHNCISCFRAVWLHKLTFYVMFIVSKQCRNKNSLIWFLKLSS